MLNTINVFCPLTKDIHFSATNSIVSFTRIGGQYDVPINPMISGYIRSQDNLGIVVRDSSDMVKTVDVKATAVEPGTPPEGGTADPSVLHIVVLPQRTYKLAVWIVKDRNESRRSSTRTDADVNLFAEQMTSVWQKQAAIDFRLKSVRVITMDQVNGSLNGVNDDRMKEVRKYGYDSGSDVINIYCVYKIADDEDGHQVLGQASIVGGLKKAGEFHWFMFNDACESETEVTRTLSHEFGHLAGLDHIKNNDDLSFYIPERPFDQRGNRNLMRTKDSNVLNGNGIKLRWMKRMERENGENQIDVVNKTIGRN